VEQGKDGRGRPGVLIASQFPTDLPAAVAGSTATKLFFSQTNVEQLLLGKQSARFFLQAHGKSERVEWGVPQEVRIDGVRATAFAVDHPAYRRRKPEVVDTLYASVAQRVRGILTTV